MKQCTYNTALYYSYPYIIKWLFLVITSLLLNGVLYEQFCRWSLERTHFKKKTFVQINGAPLYYVKKGTGTYTVVFQSGMAVQQEFKSSVNDVQSDLLNLSSNSTWIKSSKSGHLIQINDAQLLIDEIQRSVRSKTTDQ
ncbi:hypothetical protein HCX49_03885 [Sphingobacterium kitahiroshimense]|uniref:hypothetical protein n=1 Tax=Sphingobacterium sp. B16(2022) TaxID=2914044 RepID=UPI00143C4F48|nr:hypothetical protein [Sphingobacterium sp. B16(2022)]NJI72337.1 hypothetical protein [Sphingobacterium sp. B16(2022)]